MWKLKACATVFLLITSTFFIILWCKVYSVLIQKFSLLINLWHEMYFKLVLFVNWSIMMTCACFFSWKCLIANMASVFFYFFTMTTHPDVKVSLRFSYVFIFPSCTRKLNLFNNVYDFLVCQFLKTDEEITCL